MTLRFLYPKLFVVGIVVVSAGFFAGCIPQSEPDLTPAVEEAADMTEAAAEEVVTTVDGVLEKALPEGIDPEIATMEFDNSWMLTDSLGGDAVGVVTTTFSDKFYLQADAQNLPELGENEFYEGWVVRGFPRSVVSTGELIRTPDGWVNQFTSETDYTDHKEYFVTLEPTNDGANGEADPAPTTVHVLEGKSK